ncbi:MAG: hypothetical protein QOH91_3165 [Mycobacterium sp.]|jgi:serine/threonine-protein kinase|nr:hypothetical protein [Mycobacterium sp.]
MRLLKIAVATGSVLVLVGGCSSGSAPSPQPPKSSAPAKPEPALNGTFKVQVGNNVGDDGKTSPEGAGTFDLVARSLCKDGRCVATAAAPQADDPNAITAQSGAKSLVFDYLDGRWVAVFQFDGLCVPAGGGDQQPARGWRTYALEPKPDGTWSGEYVGRNSLEACGGSGRQPLTMTRTGDADPNVKLPDPAAQPPFKSSPANGFRGKYLSSITQPGSGAATENFTATTSCMRTGDLCLTYLTNPQGIARAMQFADGKWTESSAPFSAACPSGEGGTAQVVTSAELALPQPAGDPITVVTGHWSQAYTGDCTTTVEADVKYERTGD